ncbi:MAG: hypothetical protein OHK0029_20560 [Armatimonadaceae bacterium]
MNEEQDGETEQVTRPCPHMKTLISGLADDSLTGMMRWFTEMHAKGCGPCGSAVAQLKGLRMRLRGLNAPCEGSKKLALSEERRAAIEAAWQRMDEESVVEETTR